MTSHSAPCIQWDMQGFLVQCLDVYRQLAGPTSAPFRKVVTPYLDQKPETPEELAKAGALASVASKILMKVLYAARMARPDLLRATCYLATRITKWTEQCDRMLFRLMCYIHSSLGACLHGWMGDAPAKVEQRVFSCACVAQAPLSLSGPQTPDVRVSLYPRGGNRGS